MTPWTAACQAPQSMGYPRQEFWSGLPFPSPGDLPDSGTEPTSPALAREFLTAGIPKVNDRGSLSVLMTVETLDLRTVSCYQPIKK